MAANDLSQFHELAEQFMGEIPLNKICEREGVRYHVYISRVFKEWHFSTQTTPSVSSVWR